MKRILIASLSLVFALSLTLARPASSQDQKQAVQEKVAAFKQSLAENQKALRQYTWTENTQLSLKGEVKSSKVEVCRYGPDGKVQKTLASAPPAKKEMRGIKKRVVEKKTDEMKDYMERVVNLIERYVPPPPDLIKADVAAGNVSMSPQEPAALQLQFKNFVKSGDVLSVTVDTAAKQPPPAPRKLIKLESWRRPRLLAVSKPLHPDVLQVTVDAGVSPPLVWIS